MDADGFVTVHTHNSSGALELELSSERELQHALYSVTEEKTGRGTNAGKKWTVKKTDSAQSPKYTITFNDLYKEFYCTCKDFYFRSKERRGKPRTRQNGQLSYFNSVNLWRPEFVRDMPEDNTRGVILGAFKGCKHILAVKRSLPSSPDITQNSQ